MDRKSKSPEASEGLKIQGLKPKVVYKWFKVV